MPPPVPIASSSSSAKRRKARLSEHNGNMREVSPGSLSTSSYLAVKDERDSLVLWKSPVKTLNYFKQELSITLMENGRKLWHRKWLVLLLLALIFALVASCRINGPHQHFVRFLEKRFFWCSYWVGLGILSSVGLGTGLHTFLLYLGPHIASVTLAAYECGTLKFPEPPYPDEIICPDDDITLTSGVTISLWSIMSKVRLEAFMWGAGTALGELPPYFMARAARMSGFDADDENLEEFEELLQQQEHPENQSMINRAKSAIQKLVERVGFVGILACASIPNPLFDLAGITCGHFLVPFWTFFGATLIGKAVIKMHIQKLFVIIAFNEALVERAVNMTERVPHVGKYLHEPFRDFLEKQKAKLHRKTGSGMLQEPSWLSAIFEKIVVAMIVYFVLSIVNSMAQRYHKRLCKNQQEPVKKMARD